MKDLLSKPNQITYIRILLIPIFVIFLLMDMPYRDYIAAFIFIILSLSDALDGYIARKNDYGQATLTIDGEELFKTLRVTAEVTAQVEDRTIEEENTFEIEPRNTGK